MVWFQCEDCGENLKKPKLQNHFRICSANKLSCIDCGFIFNRESVQAHTQCVSEAEKYGPKGEGKSAKNLGAKEKPNASQNADVDLSAGLSTRPPWACSLCNVKTTSRDTLLLHSEGKKHRSKARALQASNKSNQTVDPSLNGNISLGGQGSVIHLEQPNAVDRQSEEKHKVGQQEEVEFLDCTDDKKDAVPDSSKGPNIEEEKDSKKRKRKGDKSKSFDSMNVENKQDQIGQQEVHLNGSNQTPHLSAAKEGKGYKLKKMDKIDPVHKSTNWFDRVSNIGENGNGLVTEGLLIMNAAKQNKEKPKKKIKQTDQLPNIENDEVQTRDQGDDAVEDTHGSDRKSSKLPVKWKKIIKSVLKESPEGSLRMKKLQKAVVPLAIKALETAGVAADESDVKDELIRKVSSSSRFVVDNKTVYLV